MADDADDHKQQALRERRKRNIVLGLVLGGIVVLFFVMTVVKLAIRFGG
ncbi:MAG: hypothetical protein GC166_06855 [Alphaproteobacteria bacterium]|nr:hypothetical protein [Alphaproteobacteria bacterium]